MRILSYNILDGGEGRADPLAEVIEANRPDIVTLIEADDLSVVERIANRLKMDYVVGPGPRHAVAVLSRWEIRDSVNHTPLHRDFTASFLETTIRSPGHGQQDLAVCAVHLHARAAEADEQVRERQLDVILRSTARHRDARQPHVLAGDFNANGPTQRIDVAKAKPATREAHAANGGRLPRRVVRRLLDAGYTDTLRAAAGDRADSLASFTTLHPQQRVDYIFTHGIPPARIKAAWIEHDRLATYASDHYPVGAEIERA